MRIDKLRSRDLFARIVMCPKLRTLFLFGVSLFLTGQIFAGDTPLRLATTTSTANSGLMDYLLPIFTAETSIEVHMIAVGTGKALRLGREGDVDLVLVHARPAEEAFVENGYGVDRADVMYNDFVIVGPLSDPAQVRSSKSVAEVLGRIGKGTHRFVSRGDDSGTHKRELILWQSAGASPAGEWYREVGQGMGKTLQIANEMDAYTMTDRGTWLAYQGRLDLQILFQGDPPLFNPYGIIAVNPVRHAHVKYAEARQFIDWIVAPENQQLIGGFKVQGQQLFIPSAGAASQ